MSFGTILVAILGVICGVILLGAFAFSLWWTMFGMAQRDRRAAIKEKNSSTPQGILLKALDDYLIESGVDAFQASLAASEIIEKIDSKIQVPENGAITNRQVRKVGRNLRSIDLSGVNVERVA